MSTLLLLKFTTILLVILVLKARAQNYCNPNLCKGRGKHIACNNEGEFSSNCGSSTSVVPMTADLRKTIVDMHNQKRNAIAGGKLARYKRARRMATIQWDAELARLAVLNAKQCAMKHDKCRNTKRFPLAGQNLAYSYWFGKTRTVKEVLKSHINKWWDEHKDCSMSYIKKYRLPPKGSKDIGHFTQMAQERATHVGCGIVRTTRNGSTYQYLACDYAMTNIDNQPVYRSGKTAALCRTGRNTYYKNLCKKNEVYNLKSGKYN